ncbi:hypothetical protein GCM10022198_04190 [Klugiella xanthotipulae]|uniref:DUF1273 family protein n=1 Tax=Klugiella xanthotipulae TaxID=244735 RepID=A0A543HSL0_9MICO|nr:hypothetical protein [Klugiella xanthotipulae]TQM61322.1 hypothetical protein FB466_2271 [Klugiella xanthotipulae]
MTRIGITGHQDIPADALDFIVDGIRAVLSTHEEVTGYSCLAAGADQLFAVEILRTGGQLHVVVPCTDYDTTFNDRELEEYHGLFASAVDTTRLPYPAPSEQAYDAAGRYIVENVDLMVAVWDGEPARGQGGTGDVVAYARELGVEVRVVWPQGVRRDPAS